MTRVATDNRGMRYAKTIFITIVLISFIVGIGIIVFDQFSLVHRISYGNDQVAAALEYTKSNEQLASTTPVLASITPPLVVAHIPTPYPVRGVYFTSWAAGTPSFQKSMFDIVSGSTTINSLVIDVKDYSGRISFPINNPIISSIGSVQQRIPNIQEMIGKLHEKGIYVIGRVAVFQDPWVVKVHPEWAVHDKSTGLVWKDSGGAYWADPDRQEMWQYVSAIAQGAYAVGFDEINFDYVRFPSDGISTAVFDKTASTTKAEVITQFFAYLHNTLSPLGIPISADIFGQVTSDMGDMGIGQHFESVLPYVDFIDPMVYPSHYIHGFLDFPKPAEHPYEVVKYELATAVSRAMIASSSPNKIRPWLQAFDLGAIYTPSMVHDQIRATADAGANGWLLWNAGSVYNKEFIVNY
jgi:hypothetical protein